MKTKNLTGLLFFALIMADIVSAQPWSGITELTQNDSDDETYPDSDCEPQLVAYNDRLYVVWFTCNDNITGGNDMDIVIRCYDGVVWSKTVEITYKNDTGNDFAPQICVYDNKLYIVWQTLDDVISDGSDMDIVIRCYDSEIGDINDTNAWGDITELTPIGDSDGDYNPQLCSYNNRLYVSWETSNPSITTGGDKDIVIKSYDGNVWGECKEVTLQTDNYDDTYPYLGVYQDKLWVVWQTFNDSIFGNYDDDIFCRYYDSSLDVWSDVVEITQPEDNTVELCVEDKYPIMTVYKDKLYVLWQRKEFLENGENRDSDLVMKSYEGISWSDVINVTSGNNAEDGSRLTGCGVDFTVYNTKLYIIWQSQSGGGVDWDIFIKSYDGERFGHITELTPISDFESDDHPYLAVYDGKLYVAWQTQDNTTSSGADSDIVIRSITIQTENISGYEIEIAYGSGGALNVEETAKPGELPEGLTDIGIIINVTGNSTNAQITIRYNEDDVPENYSESSMKMYYWNGTSWNKIEESGVDTVNNIVWANVSHFTIFVPAAAKFSQSAGSPWYLEPDVSRALIIMASAIVILVVVIQVLIYRMTLHSKGKNKPVSREERIKARRKARKKARKTKKN